jgi:XapX domain-containing protein
MIGYLVSLLMGAAAGIAYGLAQVRSPAPPLIALIGLLGMVVGEQAINAARHHYFAAAPASVEQANDELSITRGPASNRMPDTTAPN